MKVLWVMKEFEIGGAERLLLELSSRMEDVGFRPVAVTDGSRTLVPYLQAAGMDPVSLGAKGPLDVGWLVRLRRLAKSEQPDVVHVQNPYPAAGSRLALAGLRVPLVYTEHSLWPSHRTATRLANMATYWMNDVTVAVSEAVRTSIAANALGRSYAKRVTVVRNGIDPEAVRSDADQGTDVHVPEASYGTVTHLNRNKAPEVLMSAAARLSVAGVDAPCYIIGGGPLAGELQRRRSQLNATHVQLLGARRDARAIMARLKVFVIPSRHEGLPMVLLEALALGVPVVATSVGGIGEVLSHRETGLLVPSEDPAALADAIRELLVDETLAKDLSRRGRELVETAFHVDTTAARLLSIYRGVAQN